MIGRREGLSSSQPPLFDSNIFSIWKTRFRIYARSQGVKVWMAIEDGVTIPTKEVGGKYVKKKVSKYSLDKEIRMNIVVKEEMVLTRAFAEKRI